MEKEVKELLTEEDNRLVEVSQKSSKGTFLGIVAVASAVLLFKFRRKIGTKLENTMVKTLTKKGYSILPPTAEISNEIEEILV